MIERINTCSLLYSYNYIVWCYFLSYPNGCIRIILLCEPNEQINPLESLRAPGFSCLDDDGRLDNNPVSSCAGWSMKFRVEQIHGWLLRCIASVKLIGTFKLLSMSCQLLPESNQFWMEPNLTCQVF
jgi:hypothetical protein